MCDKDKRRIMFGAVVILPCRKCREQEEFDKKQMAILMKQDRNGTFVMARNSSRKSA